jgi:hypothetical protein
MNTLKIHVVEDVDGHPEDLDKEAQRRHAEDLDEKARGLGQELLELDGTAVSPVQDTDAPPGTRTDVHYVAGVIGLSVMTGGIYYRVKDDVKSDVKKLAASIVRVIQSWQERNNGKKALIELPDGSKVEVTGYSESTTHKIFKAMLENSEKQRDVES